MVSPKAYQDIDTNRMNSIIKDVIDNYVKSRTIFNSPGRPITEKIHTIKDNQNLAKALEHSMIIPNATPEMVGKFCAEAVKYGFVNVSVPVCFVKMTAGLLKGTGVKTSSAVAFPYGNTTTRMKVEETLEIIDHGGVEIDMPINVGLLKSGDVNSVSCDIKSVLEAAGQRALIKVVVDLGQLSDEEKIRIALIAKVSGAAYLKVAAGSKPGGVTAEDIKMIRAVVGNEMGIKADGGIRDYQAAVKVLKAGATRIGASGSVKIITGS